LLWPALAVLAAQVLAAVLAPDRGLSVWGSRERAQGLLTTLSYVLLFLVVAARLRALPQAWRLAGAMVAAVVPIVGLGLAQELGLDPIGLVRDARSPIYGTLGRSNFVGAYLAMVLPLTLALMLATRRRWMRVAAALLVAGQAGVVGLTPARGAWLTAVVRWGALACFGRGPGWLRAGVPCCLSLVAWRCWVPPAVCCGWAGRGAPRPRGWLSGGRC
jgi:hypothetical protein